MSSSSSARGGRQNLDELEGRMELGIELGEEMEEEEAHLSPVCRSKYPVHRNLFAMEPAVESVLMRGLSNFICMLCRHFGVPKHSGFAIFHSTQAYSFSESKATVLNRYLLKCSVLALPDKPLL